jgi:RNA polymerase sigma-70 factor (ECF subfamily)
MSQTQEDKKLVEQSLLDSNHFRFIVEKYQAPLIRYVRRLLSVPMEDAEDIVQEVFIKIYQNLNGYNPQLPFSSWIYRITHNASISFYRATKKHKNNLSVDDDENEKLINSLELSFNPKNQIEAILLMDHARQAIDCLPKNMRAVAVLRFLEDKSYQEISDILRLPIGSVATAVARSRKKIVEKMS